MAWEEVYDGRKSRDQLAIYREGDRYEVEWVVWGHQIQERRDPVPREAVESFLRGEHTGDDLIGYAMDGGWPVKLTPEEEKEASRKFLLGNLDLLVTIPENQSLFSVEELEELMPKARQAYERVKGEEDYDPWAEDDLGEE